VKFVVLGGILLFCGDFRAFAGNLRFYVFSFDFGWYNTVSGDLWCLPLLVFLILGVSVFGLYLCGFCCNGYSWCLVVFVKI